jgi:hypothetical protein
MLLEKMRSEVVNKIIAISLLTVGALGVSPAIAQEQSDRTAEKNDQATAKKLDVKTVESSSLADAANAPAPVEITQPYDYGGLIRESLLFLGIEHAFRLGFQGSTRAELKGPFFNDWFESDSHLRGWRDGDPFIINYMGHPMQGSITGFIQIQNDPVGKRLVFSADKEYWKSRSKAVMYAAIYEIQFELGPISESSLGNSGLKETAASKHPQSYVDFVITPTLGAVWLLSEDVVDRYVITRLELRTDSRVRRIVLRTTLNPSRTFSNMMRFKVPWYRDSRTHGVSW